MKAKKIAFSGVMGALAIAVSLLEGVFDIPFLPPGAKPGLSNVITMAGAMLGGVWPAMYITAVKALFALVTRGATAFLLSSAGGIISALATVMLLKMKKCPFSLVGIGIIGAVLHNMGQLLASVIITKTDALIFYAPVLVAFAFVTGGLTGFMLTVLRPELERIGRIVYEANHFGG